MRFRFGWSAALLALGLLAGCGQHPPLHYDFNAAGLKQAAAQMNVQLTNQAAATIRTQVLARLNATFGTPENPKVPANPIVEDSFQVKDEDGTEHAFTLKGAAELYRINCMHCHGVSGGADGPTAPWLNPRPRDYRAGVFKFKSTHYADKPTEDDLYRTVTIGVAGTAMPAFDVLLDAAQRRAIVKYVIHLAMRGDVELRFIKDYLDSQNPSPDDLAAEVTDVVESWVKAPDSVVNPADSAKARLRPTPVTAAWQASVASGRALFLGDKADCKKCHGLGGKGDGPSAGNYYDDWGHPIRPADLARGMYRGGARPIDLYRRIYTGIRGGPMPGFGENNTLTEDEIWDLVHYVQMIPYNGDALAARWSR